MKNPPPVKSLIPYDMDRGGESLGITKLTSDGYWEKL